MSGVCLARIVDATLPAVQAPARVAVRPFCKLGLSVQHAGHQADVLKKEVPFFAVTAVKE
jgi:hypothetical protein